MDANAISKRYLAEVRAAAGASRAGCSTPVALTFAFLLSVTLVLIPVAIFVLLRWDRARRSKLPQFDDALDFAGKATPVIAFPLMVNSGLLKPGTKLAPGVFLVCFDPDKGLSTPYMVGLVEKIEHSDRFDLSQADRAFCESLYAEVEYSPFRRRLLPPAITGGTDVFACDLLVDPQLLIHGHISEEMPFVPCMAERGRAGRIVQMPYWIFVGHPAPPNDLAKVGFITSLVSVGQIAAMAKQSASKDNRPS